MAQGIGSIPYRAVPTHHLAVHDVRYAYRDLGPREGTPLVVLTHLGANLDGWDPRLIDGLAADRRVVALGYRGVGGSSGRVRDSIEAMAADVVDATHALGLTRVDVLGLSMGGMVAQAVAARSPGLIDRLVLVGSGPQGGPGLRDLTRAMVTTTLWATVTSRDPRELLFFTRTPNGRAAARAYLERLKERTADREPAVGLGVLRAQLAAVHRWGSSTPTDPPGTTGPVLIVHGDSDRMVPPANASALLERLPTATPIVHPDSGHGVAFQNVAQLVSATGDFLSR